MRAAKRMAATLAACVLAGAAGRTGAAETKPVQTEHELNRQISADNPGAQKPAAKTARIRYLLYLPPGGAEKPDKAKRLPLVLFLHGAGERGDDLQLLKKHGPPKLVERGKQFPFILVSPQCPKGKWWDVGVLTALLDEIVEKHPVDEDRVYATGLSMGGFGTWMLGARTPERFAALAPICGGGDPRSAGRLKDLPIWVFHGGKDNVVPVKKSREMVEAITAAGGKQVKLTVYPEARHDSWTKTYANDEFYTWLLSQKRPQPTKPPRRARP